MLFSRLAKHNMNLSYRKEMHFKTKDHFKLLFKSPLNPPLPKHENILGSKYNPRFCNRTFSIIGVGLLYFWPLKTFFPAFFLIHAGYTSLPHVMLYLWLMCNLRVSPTLVLREAGELCLILPSASSHLIWVSKFSSRWTVRHNFPSGLATFFHLHVLIFLVTFPFSQVRKFVCCCFRCMTLP